MPKVTLSYSTFTFKRIAFAIIVACSREKNLRVYLAYFILFLFSTTKVNHCYRITLQECAVEESAQLAIVVKYYCFQITTPTSAGNYWHYVEGIPTIWVSNLWVVTKIFNFFWKSNKFVTILHLLSVAVFNSELLESMLIVLHCSSAPP